MKPPGWWVWPLVAAAVIDFGLVARYERSPGLAVDRAVLRSVEGPNCQQAVLLRGNGVDDSLFVFDTWSVPKGVVSVPATVQFSPDQGLTTQSRETIAAGQELDLTALHQPRHGSALSASQYGQQIAAGASWLAGPCIPFSNPFQSHLRREGSFLIAGRPYTLYIGHVRYERGAFQLFAAAVVWIGVRPDGRLGFEVLHQVPGAGGPGASASAVATVATVFQYPQSHLNAKFLHEGAQSREEFYRTEYGDVLRTLGGLGHAASRPAA